MSGEGKGSGGAPTVALLGSTGKTGGWVLEEALAAGFHVRALVRDPRKLEAHTERSEAHTGTLVLVKGSATDPDAIARLLEGGVDVVIGTLGSPSKQMLIMRAAAEALVKALANLTTKTMAPPPRVVWLTTIGVNEATAQGHKYGLSARCLPACSCCCGWGCFGCLVFKCLIPYVIGQGVWDDMGLSEDVIRNAGDAIRSRTVLVRPTNMHPPSEAAAFSDAWRKEGGENVRYQTRRADEVKPYHVVLYYDIVHLARSLL